VNSREQIIECYLSNKDKEIEDDRQTFLGAPIKILSFVISLNCYGNNKKTEDSCLRRTSVFLFFYIQLFEI
jgi:hypothetical protein